MEEIKEPVVAIIDVETTGINPDKDRVIEFAVQKGLDSNGYSQSWRVNPGIPIPAGASAVHGIYDDDVKDKPPFAALIPVIQKIIAGTDIIVGYNLEFDLRCIASEFRRAGAEPLEISKKLQIDPLKIWRHFEPRKLEDAVRRFVGEEHESAHSAEGDVAATGKVLKGMLKQFGLGQMSWIEVANILEPERSSWVGPSSHLRWKEGAVVINFGRNSGRTLHDIFDEKDGYFDWILKQDFPAHVKIIVREVAIRGRGQLEEWIIEQYGPPII